MRYSFVIVVMLVCFPVFAEDEFMVIGPESGPEKEFFPEQCATNTDTPVNDSLEGNDMVDE